MNIDPRYQTVGFFTLWTLSFFVWEMYILCSHGTPATVSGIVRDLLALRPWLPWLMGFSLLGVAIGLWLHFWPD